MTINVSSNGDLHVSLKANRAGKDHKADLSTLIAAASKKWVSDFQHKAAISEFDYIAHCISEAYTLVKRYQPPTVGVAVNDKKSPGGLDGVFEPKTGATGTYSYQLQSNGRSTKMTVDLDEGVFSYRITQKGKVVEAGAVTSTAEAVARLNAIHNRPRDPKGNSPRKAVGNATESPEKNAGIKRRKKRWGLIK